MSLFLNLPWGCPELRLTSLLSPAVGGLGKFWNLGELDDTEVVALENETVEAGVLCRDLALGSAFGGGLTLALEIGGLARGSGGWSLAECE